MDFRPVNADHAVLSASFSAALDKPVSGSRLQLLSNRQDLLAELPAVQTPQGFELQVVPGQVVPHPQKLQGIQLSHLRPDGTAAWALRLLGIDLAVECNRYTRWDHVWDTARRYLKAGFEAAGEHKVAAIGFVMVDAFVAKREDYDLQSLLRRGPLLADRIFSAGPTWHNYLGWFDERPSFVSNCHWLNQLNVEAVRLAPGDLRVQIAHNQELRFEPASEIPSEAGLDLWFSELHLNNKRVLADLLEPSVSGQIGLASK
ncbi:MULTISPECIES: hypothetical protein [Bradyrhizobium]|jgi:hypothetical protein|uniref:hypothetical protein n=1 Tax=Bradyrhizobium TaxID=374 RepID=UPI00057074F2|nr:MULTISPECIES: hypothetical protein [Bradyrhizobium]MDI2109517.1 hypothetical protein [Bradyrhizobium sp. Mp64]WLB04508.1 hypothetical protein QNJ80_21950 [Bradyrhizobium elkanii]